MSRSAAERLHVPLRRWALRATARSPPFHGAHHSAIATDPLAFFNRFRSLS